MKKKHLLIRTSAAVLSAAMIAGTTPVTAAASEDFEVAEKIEAVDSEESEVEEFEESEAEEPEFGVVEETKPEETREKEVQKTEFEEFEELPVMYNGDGTAPALIAADGYSILDKGNFNRKITNGFKADRDYVASCSVEEIL